MGDHQAWSKVLRPMAMYWHLETQPALNVCLCHMSTEPGPENVEWMNKWMKGTLTQDSRIPQEVRLIQGMCGFMVSTGLETLNVVLGIVSPDSSLHVLCSNSQVMFSFLSRSGGHLYSWRGIIGLASSLLVGLSCLLLVCTFLGALYVSARMRTWKATEANWLQIWFVPWGTPGQPLLRLPLLWYCRERKRWIISPQHTHHTVLIF